MLKSYTIPSTLKEGKYDYNFILSHPFQRIRRNNQDFGDRRGLLLMDAGTEKCGYTSDITRVWPVGGRFSPQQKAIYESVLSIQVV